MWGGGHCVVQEEVTMWAWLGDVRLRRCPIIPAFLPQRSSFPLLKVKSEIQTQVVSDTYRRQVWKG